MIDFIPVADDNPDLALSPLLQGAQLTLDYADLYYLNKVLNEQDFPPLMILHDVLLGAKLVRHVKDREAG